MKKLCDFKNVSYNPFKIRDTWDSDESDFDSNFLMRVFFENNVGNVLKDEV